MMGGSKGFTLVEVVVTVAIVALLATVAVPSYRNYVLRTNRTVAKSALVDLAARQETYFVNYKRYATSLSALSLSAYLSKDGSTASTQGSAIYQLSVAAHSTSCPASGTASATSYTVLATPVGTVQTKDTTCGTLCLTSTGIRKASGSATDCWQR